VVAAVALGTYLPHGFQGLFSRDLGVYAYGARQVLAGQPPYVGIVNLARKPDLVPASALEMEFGRWKPVLEPDYVKVGVTPGAVWFARRSLGPDVIQALRQANTALSARDS
jgi:hypothetical protein